MFIFAWFKFFRIGKITITKRTENIEQNAKNLEKFLMIMVLKGNN